MFVEHCMSVFLAPCAVAERRAVAGALRTVCKSKRKRVLGRPPAWFVHSRPFTSNSGLLLLLPTPRVTPDCTGHWAELLPASAQALFDEPQDRAGNALHIELHEVSSFYSCISIAFNRGFLAF